VPDRVVGTSDGPGAQGGSPAGRQHVAKRSGECAGDQRCLRHTFREELIHHMKKIVKVVERMLSTEAGWSWG
jgi:uncharacterized protein